MGAHFAQGRRSEEPQLLQNTILDQGWEDTYSQDVAILQSLINADRELQADGDGEQKSVILQTLQEELAHADECEGFNELLESIERFMETYKRHISSNIIDQTAAIKRFRFSRALELRKTQLSKHLESPDANQAEQNLSVD